MTQKVLLLDTGKEWGGGTNSMIELLKRIDRQRFDITALFYRDYRKGNGSTLGAELAAIGIPLRLLPPEQPPWWEKPAKELARAFCFGNRDRIRRAIFAIERRTRIEPMAKRIATEIRNGGFDLLYMNNQPGSNVEGYLAALTAGTPVIQHCRVEPELNHALTTLINQHAAAVICVSKGTRDVLVASGVAAERCRVVHNGIDCAQSLPEATGVREEFCIPANALVIGTVGRLLPIKRVGDLIRACARLAHQFPERDIRLVIAGDGEEAARLEMLAASQELSKQVVFVGFSPQPLRVVGAMDIFALASTSEGLPRAILEAMLMSRPVVASNVNGSREVVEDGVTGLLYPCGDVAALTAALARLADDAALRQRMGAAGARRARENFSIERYVAGVENVLAEVRETQR